MKYLIYVLLGLGITIGMIHEGQEEEVPETVTIIGAAVFWPLLVGVWAGAEMSARLDTLSPEIVEEAEVE